tara:strand:+ start:269146 stop:269307 length:162 start_codon:yes stop_codon:yes gene_type:complete
VGNVVDFPTYEIKPFAGSYYCFLQYALKPFFSSDNLFQERFLFPSWEGLGVGI